MSVQASVPTAPRTHHDAFLEAIIAAPADDTPRLVYADWLEEHGGNAGAVRAEFIRESVRWPSASFARLTSAADPFPLLGLTPGKPQPFQEWDDDGNPRKELRTWMWGESEDMGCVIHDLGRRMNYKIDRGFVAAVRCSCADFLTHRDVLLTVAPLERVTLTHAAAGRMRREGDTLVCGVYPVEQLRRPQTFALEVRDGKLWYAMDPDGQHDQLVVRVEPCQESEAERHPGVFSIEDAFRDYWNDAVAARYAREARQIMRREIIPDLSF